MADKFTDAPIGATHWGTDAEREHVTYYKYDGHVWKFWFVREWRRCGEKLPLFAPMPLPPRITTPAEHTLCCGTTCDKQAVNRYIKQLEEVADAARGFLAANDELRSVLSEVGK